MVEQIEVNKIKEQLQTITNFQQKYQKQQNSLIEKLQTEFTDENNSILSTITNAHHQLVHKVQQSATDAKAMQQSIIAHVSQVKTDLGTALTTHINDMSDHLKEMRLFIDNLPPLRFTQPSSGLDHRQWGQHHQHLPTLALPPQLVQ
eukprot:5197879-Ditylum_brightwellii.AAC.1